MSWFDENLQISVRKTEEMVLDSRPLGDLSCLNIPGNDIRQVTSYKYLGVSALVEISAGTLMLHVSVLEPISDFISFGDFEFSVSGISCSFL